MAAKNDSYKDVFKKACLVQLSSSIWQCSRTIEQSLMKKLSENGENTEWLKGRKYLINPELLGPVRTAVHQSRNMIKKFALPFPITSIYLVPKESLAIVDERLDYFKNRYWDKVFEFEAIYDAALEEARDNLGDLFNETDYPTDIRTKFNFEWRYLALTVPSKATLLTPEIYEREKEKFKSLMAETRETAMIALREEFAGIVNILVDKLTDDYPSPKQIKGPMFNKLQEFLSEFQTRNIFDDDELVSLAEQAKEVIDGVSPYNLKYNHDLRTQIGNEMTTIKEAIETAIVDMPRRKIQLPNMEDAA